MADTNGNGNGGAAMVQLAEIRGGRERVPVAHLLTALGLVAGIMLYLQSSLVRIEESFDLRIERLDEALQREQRDLDRTLEVQIENLKELSATNNSRFVAFIDSFRIWQLEEIEKSAYARGQADARLAALERNL